MDEHEQDELQSKIDHIDQTIGYRFRDSALLRTALTHASYANEHDMGSSDCYERMEYLGDAVLEMVISSMIYRRYPNDREGMMTMKRSMAVSEKTLSSLARRIELGRILYFGKSEVMTDGCDKESILADAFESLIAAVFLDAKDCGFLAVKKVIEILFEDIFQIYDDKQIAAKIIDYRSLLLMHFQQNGKDIPEFNCISEDGPDHKKIYTVAVVEDGKAISKGQGRSKKQAAQNASKEALGVLGIPFPAQVI